MPKAPAGARWSSDRSRRARKMRVTSASRLHRRSLGLARALIERLTPATVSEHPHSPSAHQPRAQTRVVRLASRLRSGTRSRLGSDRAVPIGAALILLAASVFSYSPAFGPGPAQGGTTAIGAEPRLAIGGSDSLEFEPIGDFSDESYAPIELEACSAAARRPR